MAEWKPLSRLAGEIGIPEASVRRYALEYFPTLIRVQRRGRANLVNPDSVPILKKAHVLLAEGHGREYVREALAREFGQVHEVVVEPGEPIAGDVRGLVPPESQTDLAIISRAALATAIREVESLRSRVSELEAAKSETERKFAELLAEVATLKSEKPSWWRRWLS